MITFDDTTEIILEELEKTSKQYWNISRETANFLSILIKAVKPKEVLEIGTSNGYSGIWIAKALKEVNGHLMTIEFWDNRQSIAIENFKKCGVDDIITPKLGSALKIIDEEIKYPLDFVFIDANKSEYVKYFDLLHPLVKKGGIIAADNVLSHEEKVKPFVDKIKNHPDYQAQILNLPAGLLLAYKL